MDTGSFLTVLDGVTSKYNDIGELLRADASVFKIQRARRAFLSASKKAYNVFLADSDLVYGDPKVGAAVKDMCMTHVGVVTGYDRTKRDFPGDTLLSYVL